MSQKLYVGGIAFTTTSDGLRQHFAQSGTVVSASIVTDQFSGQSRGFGFVEMSSADEAQQAVSQLHDRQLDGRSLRWRSRSRRPTSPAPAGSPAAAAAEAGANPDHSRTGAPPSPRPSPSQEEEGAGW